MTSSNTIKIGIIGAAGLSAGRLLRILLNHPNAEIFSCVSESSPGKPVAGSHPELRGRTDLTFDSLDIDKLSQCDVVFSCKKAGDTFPYIRQLLGAGCRVIDLSGDYRLVDPEEYSRWYGLEHQHADLLNGNHAVYGMPEIYREKIKSAQLIANPGCYTTTSILACAPFISAGIGLHKPVIINAISGVSGAGRNAKPENQFLSVSENIKAYRIGTHQHTPEIEQELNLAAQRSGENGNFHVLFVPHVGPYRAGILADCFLAIPDTMKNFTVADAYGILQEAYNDEPFVRVYEPGQLPQIEYVVGTNFCDLGVSVDPRTETLVVVSATDNLVKGAAGQAIQNMNIMFGIVESVGLSGI
jgi:N-acetyl-gamma-glutamyl-phosphate reductase